MKTPITKNKDSIIIQINESLKGSVKTHALNAINLLCERGELLPLSKNEMRRMRGIGRIAIDFFERIGVVGKPIGEVFSENKLSVRASRVLEYLDIKSPEEAAEKIKNGAIDLKRVRLSGKKTSKEICHWAGVPEFSDGIPVEQAPYRKPLLKAILEDFRQYMPNLEDVDINHQFQIDNVEKVLKNFFITKRKVPSNS